MKFGVLVFPASNCDRDMMEVLQHDLRQEVIQLWHKDKDISMFNTDDCIVLPGGFSYGDYLRCGAIARFSPMMQSVIEFANKLFLTSMPVKVVVVIVKAEARLKVLLPIEFPYKLTELL